MKQTQFDFSAGKRGVTKAPSIAEKTANDYAYAELIPHAVKQSALALVAQNLGHCTLIEVYSSGNVRWDNRGSNILVNRKDWLNQ